MLNDTVSSSNNQLSSIKQNKLSSNIKHNSLYLLSLTTAAIYLLNLGQSAFAIDLEKINKHTFDSGNSSLNEKYDGVSQRKSQNYNSRPLGFFPRLFSLIKAPFINQTSSSLLPKVDKPTQDSATGFNFDGTGGSFIPNLTPIYLSQAESSSQKKFLTAARIKPIQTIDSFGLFMTNLDYKMYSVKAGDTINLIAQKYQVNSEKLVALNEIVNSDLIEIGQKIKIPVNNLNSNHKKELTFTQVGFPHNAATYQKSVNQNISPQYVAHTQLDSRSIAKLGIEANISAQNLQERRLGNLRADIRQMRAEIKLEKQNKKNKTFNIENADLETSVDSDMKQNIDSSSEELATLPLPPLPASEEYLPEAFDGYSWPAQGILSSGYGWRWGRLHKGIDIAAPVGTPIFAAASGEVISAGWNSGGFGNLVKLKHLDGSMTLYAHNSRILVSNGQKVNQGQQIAEMGNTGFSTGSHLHFEIHAKNRGVVDPLAFLEK